MSRNLARSSCCGNVVRLSDLRGKPIEFRRYGQYAPVIGTRWDCPTCSTAYFAWWRENYKFWSKPENADLAEFAPGYANTEKGRFVIRDKQGIPMENSGTFTLDLSYYASFNDELPESASNDDPWHLCLDDAEDCYWVWGRTYPKHAFAGVEATCDVCGDEAMWHGEHDDA